MGLVSKILETGNVLNIGDGSGVYAAKLKSGKYAIFTLDDREWESDNPAAQGAIQNSIQMLEINLGIGSGTLHVRGCDDQGKFLVKLFFNDKKINRGRLDEICRE